MMWAGPAQRARRAAMGITLGVAALGATLTGCGTTTSSTNSSSGSASAASPSASASAAPLTDAHAARAAVKQLLAAAGTKKVVKVDISATTASLTIVRNGKPVTWAWTNGQVAQAASDIENIDQTSFDPDDFAIDDVGSLFRQAAAVSHSTQHQDLQIVEYNQGQVLMTVTTNPESATVFFRADGTMVNTLNFGSVAGLTEALKDCVGTNTSVVAVGYDPQAGLYVDVAGDQSGTVVQTTRPANLPRWSATIKGTAHQAFNPALVQPSVIANVLGDLRRATASPSTSSSGSGAATGSGTPSSTDSASASSTTPASSASSSAGSTATTGTSTSAATAASAASNTAASNTASSTSTATGSSDTPTASASLAQPDMSWVIDRRDNLAQPVLRVTTQGTTYDYTLTGTDITSLIGG